MSSGKNEADATDAPVTPPKSKKKKLIVIGAAAAVVLLGGGGGAYMMMGSKADAAPEEEHASAHKPEGEEGKAGEADVPLDVPPILVNLRSPDGAPHFLKVHVMLVPGSKTNLEELKKKLPVLIDAYQPFLRELRPEDLSGSAAVYRIKEELMVRAVAGIGPDQVKDVLVQDPDPAMSEIYEDFDLPEPPVAAMPVGELDQAGIDALFGDVSGPARPRSGLKAVIESQVISYERLPMLEVVYDRMIRTFATSMRNLTSDAIDVSMEEITSIRFGDFVNRIALPAMIGVFRVEEWRNYGLIVVESSLIYSVVDALLGGRRSGARPMIDGRGFTGIETSLVSRMLHLVLEDLAAAMQPIGTTTMTLERIETSPRFASIAGPSNICAAATLRVDMEGRGGAFSVLLPYATIEPVRQILGQRFMGEKLGPENIWGAHMIEEIRRTDMAVDVVLGETMVPLGKVRAFAPGDTIAFGNRPEQPLELHVGGVPLGLGQIGQRRGKVAVRLTSDLAKGPLQ